mgnify:FL=1
MVPQDRLRIIGKQVRGLCDLVTVCRSVLQKCHCEIGKAAICNDCEPGDLPELWYGNVEFQITRFDCTELYFDNPTASICVGFSFSYHFLFIHRIWKKKGGYEK